MSENPRVAIGDNVPPLDPPDALPKRLERDHAALFSEAAQLEAESFALPKVPADDEEAAQVSDHVVAIKKLAKRIEDARTGEGRPYLEAGRVINALFGELSEPLIAKKEGLADKLTVRVGIYNSAKAEREKAERLEKERIEREKAEAARREEQRKRDEAEAAQREAEAAAARIRQAATDKERAEAQRQMQEQEAKAAAARKEAETGEGWPDATHRICWGQVLGRATITSCGSAEEDDLVPRQRCEVVNELVIIRRVA